MQNRPPCGAGAVPPRQKPVTSGRRHDRQESAPQRDSPWMWIRRDGDREGADAEKHGVPEERSPA